MRRDAWRCWVFEIVDREGVGSWALRRVFEESCDAIVCVVVLMGVVRERVRDMLFLEQGCELCGRRERPGVLAI